MEAVIVGLIGASAAGYLLWRGYKTFGKSSGCGSGGCAGCGGCGCGTQPGGKNNRV